MSVFGIVVKSNEKKVTVFRRDSVIFCFGYERGNKDVDELWVRGQRHCWVPAVVNAAVPNIVNDVFPSLVNVFPSLVADVFLSLLNVCTSHCHCLVSLMCLEDDAYPMPFVCWKTIQTRSGWRTSKAITGSLSRQMERLSLEPLDYPNRNQWCSLLHSWTPNAAPSR